MCEATTPNLVTMNFCSRNEQQQQQKKISERNKKKNAEM